MKFGSTWLKTALLGSAMLVMSGVFAQGEAPKTHKLTIANVEGATVAVTVDGTEVKNEGQVAEGKTLVVAVTVTDATKEVESVKLGETAATPKADKYEVTMPNTDATLTVTLKAKEAPKTHKLTIANVEGATVAVTVDGTEVKNEGQVAEGKTLVVAVTVTDATKEVESVKLGETAATPKADKYEVTMPNTDATLTVTLKAKGETPANAVPLTAEFNADGGNVYLVGIKLNEKGEPAEFNFEEEHQFPFNAVKGTWYGVIAQWKEGYMIDKFQRVLVTEGKDVVFDLIAQKKVEKLTSKEGKLLAYGALIAFGSATKVTSGKFVANFKKATAVEDNAFAAVNVYPNPFAGKLVVNEVAEASRVTLVNAQGVVLRSVAVNGANQVELDVTDVPAGIYMVVVENGAARRAFKVVK